MIEEEVDWIINSGKSHTRQTLYQRTLEIAWHVKTLVEKLQVKATEERIKRQMESSLRMKAIEQRMKGVKEALQRVVNIERLWDNCISDMNKIFQFT